MRMFKTFKFSQIWYIMIFTNSLWLNYTYSTLCSNTTIYSSSLTCNQNCWTILNLNQKRKLLNLFSSTSSFFLIYSTLSSLFIPKICSLIYSIFTIWEWTTTSLYLLLFLLLNLLLLLHLSYSFLYSSFHTFPIWE